MNPTRRRPQSAGPQSRSPAESESVKVSWIAEFRRNSKQSTALIRDLITTFSRYELSVEDINGYEQERHQIRRELGELKNSVDNARHALNGPRSSPDYPVRLQAVLTQAESDIYSFRSSQRKRFEELTVEEKILTRELSSIAKALECEESDSPVQSAEVASVTPETPVEKREAIEVWKKQQEERKREMLAMIAKQEQEDRALSAQMTQQQQREHEEQRARVQQWRAERDRLKEEEQRILQEAEEARRKAEIRAAKDRLAIRGILRSEGSASASPVMGRPKTARTPSVHDGREDHKTSAVELIALLERDKKLIEEKRRRILAKQHAQTSKELAIQRLSAMVSSPKVARDVTRLYAPTAAAVARQEALMREGSSGALLPGMAQQRAIPEWRQGL